MMDYDLLEKTYALNMQFIQRNFQALHNALENTDLNRFEIVEEESSGEINITIDEIKLYPSEISKSIDIQLDLFKLSQPSIFQHLPVTYIKQINILNDNFMLDIQKHSKLIDLEKDKFYFNGYKNLDNIVPALILFGIGNGTIVKKLIESLSIDHLYIVDYDLAMLKISFHLMDWSTIFEYFLDSKRSLHFLKSNSDAESMKTVATIVNDLYKYNPMYCLNLNYITHYNHSSFDGIKDQLKEKLPRALEGWGFVDDELLSINHSLLTFKKEKNILCKKLDMQFAKDLNILIIGNGPSLDNDIESIKKLRDSHLIFSCGTAIKSLYNNGIVPDFHFEIERPIETYQVLSTSLPLDYLKTITLVGLNVLHPKVIDLFKTSLVYLRDNDSGASLLSPKYPRLDYTNPFCVNGAFSFAMYLNPKNIYLVGVDNGSVDPNKHHSSSSDYYNTDSFLSDIEIVFNQKAKGNFQDVVYTESLFLWSKQRIINCLSGYFLRNQTKVYNCSDGLFIENTTPLHLSDSTIETIDTERKSVLITEIVNIFTKLSHSDLDQVSHILQDNYKKSISILNNIKNILNSYPSKYNLPQTLDKVIQEVSELDHEHQVSRGLISGTLKIMVVMIYSHVLAMNHNNQEYEQFITESFIVINKFLEKVTLIIQDLIDEH